MPSSRRSLLAFSLGLLLAGVVVALFGMRFMSPELRWRLDLVGAKLRGDLTPIPFGDLLRWMTPGSAVFLEAMAASGNPHAGIRNLMTSERNVERGRAVFIWTCASCHGSDGRGHTGANLLDAVSSKSDWSFFSAVKWGRPGTAMAAQPLAESEIWAVHAYLRKRSLEGSAADDAQGTRHTRVDVRPEQLLNADADPTQWLTYAGNYSGHRHSRLDQVSKGNVGELRVAWVVQLRQLDKDLQVSPLVVGRTMFVTEARGGVVALDALTGAQRWAHRRPIPENLSLCCGMPNRGAAILGNTVYVATIDAQLVALDANSGQPRWSATVADHRDGYTITGAPLALPDRIIVGVAGSVFGVRGFLAAYDPHTGRQLWKFYTVPGPGEPGHDSWQGDSWKTGGAATWTTGSYDPGQDLVIWGTGNPAPQFDARDRAGDNLYSNSVIALEAKTGRLRWYYQFTPNEEHDWDSTQQPVLTEVAWQGRPRKVVLWANRNGFFYALDRIDGKFLFAKPFVKQTWNEGFDGNGKPRFAQSARPTPAGSVVWPATMTATNWWPPSYDSQRKLLFVPSSDAAGIYYRAEKPTRFQRGVRFEGIQGAFYSTNLPATAYVKAIDVLTGDVRWQTVLETNSTDFVWTVGGILSTATGVAFSGYRDNFRAFDSDSGKVLWEINLGGRVRGSPVAYAVDGRQYIAVAAGSSIFAFTLPDSRSSGEKSTARR